MGDRCVPTRAVRRRLCRHGSLHRQRRAKVRRDWLRRFIIFMSTVLFATSEARPLIKTGGLADVSGALPAALRTLGEDCRILLPAYRGVLESLRDVVEVWHFRDFYRFGAMRLHLGRMPDSGVPVYVLDSPAHFAREGGPYQDASGCDYADNAWRFALLSRIAAWLAGPDSGLDWRPEVLHCNDWQTGLAPAYLALAPEWAGRPHAATLMTIHNLAYQGVFPPALVTALGLPAHSFRVEGVEFYGMFSFLKAGLYYADWLSTVSPSYAEEIQQPATGVGMHGLLRTRRERLTGILNGIDTRDWDPQTDPHLPCRYSARNLQGKAECKRLLQADLNLEPRLQAPLFGVIARLTYQKGLDWVLQVAPGILDRGGQIVLLGTGEAGLEAAWREFARLHPGRVSVTIGYDEGLSHRIEAGCDFFLMPSRFEPCGLNQMYSLRYGTVPIVHATGGLKDTVEHGVTGFVFDHPSAHALWLAIEAGLAAYAEAKVWRRMIQAGMQRDFSWEKSARAYQDLYRTLIGLRRQAAVQAAA